MKTGCRISTGHLNQKRTNTPSRRFSKEISTWVASHFRTSRRDPSGSQRAEAFWNSRGHGLRPCCRGQFQLSFSLKPQRVPAPPVKSAGGSHLLLLLRKRKATSRSQTRRLLSNVTLVREIEYCMRLPRSRRRTRSLSLDTLNLGAHAGAAHQLLDQLIMCFHG
ncbi:MAG: hypothetical protein EWM73_02214 [Nitrospira sp.]|nr:MAG: hypothetical protein EWM73_02214 [Nitrospira sp.]